MAVFETDSKLHNHTSHEEVEEPTILCPLVIGAFAIRPLIRCAALSLRPKTYVRACFAGALRECAVAAYAAKEVRLQRYGAQSG